MLQDPATKRHDGILHPSIVTDPREQRRVEQLPAERKTISLSPYATITYSVHRDSAGREVLDDFEA